MQEHFVRRYSLIFGLIRLFGSLWIGAEEDVTLSSHMQLLSSSPFMDTSLSICCSEEIDKTLDRNKVCMLDLHDNIWAEEERMYNLHLVSARLQRLAAMDTDAHRASAHHWLIHRTKDRKVDKNSHTNLRTVSVKAPQSDPGLWDAWRFVKTDVGHFNVRPDLQRPDQTPGQLPHPARHLHSKGARKCTASLQRFPHSTGNNLQRSKITFTHLMSTSDVLSFTWVFLFCSTGSTYVKVQCVRISVLNIQRLTTISTRMWKNGFFPCMSEINLSRVAGIFFYIYFYLFIFFSLYLQSWRQ